VTWEMGCDMMGWSGRYVLWNINGVICLQNSQNNVACQPSILKKKKKTYFDDGQKITSPLTTKSLFTQQLQYQQFNNF